MKRVNFLRMTLVICVTGMCIWACNSERFDNEPKLQTSPLINDLRSFNQDFLYSKRGLTRSVDQQFSTDVTTTPSSGIWGILRKDASGAYTGGKIGLKLGGIVGPGSAIVGGVFGGLLLGAIYSAIEATKDDYKVVDNPVSEWIISGDIYDPVKIFQYYVLKTRNF